VTYQSPEDYLAQIGAAPRKVIPIERRPNGHDREPPPFDERNPPAAGEAADAAAPHEDAELPVVSVADFADKPVPDRLWIAPGMILEP
jgi:hypothetical protein